MNAHRPSRMAPHYDQWGDVLPDTPLPVRTQAEVAAIMTARGYPMSVSRVWQIEREAFEKLAGNPVMVRLMEETRK